MTVAECSGRMDADMMSGDNSLNDWRDRFRSPARSAFEGPLPPGQLRWSLRMDLIPRPIPEDWSGTHRVPTSGATMEGEVPKIKRFFQSVGVALGFRSIHRQVQ